MEVKQHTVKGHGGQRKKSQENLYVHFLTK